MREAKDLYMIAGMYSDAYKDAHGFRPRQGISPDTTNWTYDDYVDAIEKLEPIISAEIDYEKEQERKAIVEFESEVSKFLSTVPYSNRESAVSYVISKVVEDWMDDHDIKFQLGLPHYYDFRNGVDMCANFGKL